MDRSKNFLNLLTAPVFFKNTNFHRRIAQFVCPLRSVLFRYNSFARVPLTTSLLTGGGILLFSLSLSSTRLSPLVFSIPWLFVLVEFASKSFFLLFCFSTRPTWFRNVKSNVFSSLRKSSCVTLSNFIQFYTYFYRVHRELV